MAEYGRALKNAALRGRPPHSGSPFPSRPTDTHTLGALAAIRVAALANNAPVSYGALGAPVIGLAAVTSLPLLSLSASIGKIVAILALLPPWILIYLVSGRRGLRDGWPLAIVGSLGYIAGQFPIAEFVGPYLPDVVGSLGGTVEAASKFAPFVAGTAILVSWLLIIAYLRPAASQFRTIFRTTLHQMWGALLVGPFIFGLAYVFSYSGMANSMASGFAKVGTSYVLLAAVLGWIAVALSGSNTSSNALFGAFQLSVAKLLGAPLLLFPSLNSVGAEVGKPVAPQTASVGVSTTKYVRNEGEVIRYNMGWTLVMLAYLVLIGCLFYFLLPDAMRL